MQQSREGVEAAIDDEKDDGREAQAFAELAPR
jgi:hypothetical protein